MGHEKKTLSSDFAYFLTAIRKMLRALVMLHLSTSLQVFATTVSFCLLRKLNKVGR